MSAAASPTAGKTKVEVDRPAYPAEALALRVGCDAELPVDLDEPRVNVERAKADLTYADPCDRPARLGAGTGAVAVTQRVARGTDPAGCRRAIRTRPLGPGADLEVVKGSALCVLTSADPPTLALVEIVDVGGTGTAGLRVTSWRVAD
ncbi:hypothetical protein Acsp01_78490 [Actinoplanes sp. NBRC 101535]|nr:hypothetical protein Acsp01_78490 [Actinoplanes sp. NBRC 101535]